MGACHLRRSHHWSLFSSYNSQCFPVYSGDCGAGGIPGQSAGEASGPDTRNQREPPEAEMGEMVRQRAGRYYSRQIGVHVHHLHDVGGEYLFLRRGNQVRARLLSQAVTASEPSFIQA